MYFIAQTYGFQMKYEYIPRSSWPLMKIGKAITFLWLKNFSGPFFNSNQRIAICIFLCFAIREDEMENDPFGNIFKFM